MEQSVLDRVSARIDGELSADVATLVADIETPEAGFFGPGSVMWTISRERVLLLSGVSTILLQLAHPLVAAGVADHSSFEAAPVDRFRRTFDRVYAVIFGDVETAVEAALEIRGLHARVTGTLNEDVGPFPAGEQYAATDPELLLWVHATLIDQALMAYETYVAPLPETDREKYYQESKVFGRLFGIPEERYPETIADFEDYYERMLAEALAVGPRGSELRDTLFAQGRVCWPLYAFLGASTLPDPVRDEFRLPWSSRRQRVFDTGAVFVGAVLPHLPPRIRFVGAYRRARARLQRAGAPSA